MGRVLVADDEQDFAEFVRRVVSARGHAVTIAADGAANRAWLAPPHADSATPSQSTGAARRRLTSSPRGRPS